MPPKKSIKTYMANPNLKAAGVVVNFTEEQVQEYLKCSKDPVYFMRTYMKIVNLDQGLMSFDMWDFQEDIVNKIHNNRFVIAKLPRQTGKCLHVETPIPTPNGWTTMGDLKVGDKIFGTNGKEITIIGKSPVWTDHKCYRVHFDSGTSIVADAEHLWEVRSTDWSKENGRKILTTEQIIPFVNRERSGGRPYIKLPDAVQYKEKQLEIHPYLLGLWLGDGCKTSGAIYCHISDFEEYKKTLESFGEKITSIAFDKRNQNVIGFRVDNLFRRLRLMNLQKNKHIPKEYMFSSVEQRFHLLQGLLDTDGHKSPKNNSYEFYQKSKDFCDQVQELLSSLGIKNRIREKIINGETYHTVSFGTDKTVTKLKRKQRTESDTEQRNQQSRIYITHIEEIETVNVQCISVDSDDKLFLAGKSYIPTHNTYTTVGYLLHYVLFNQDVSAAILANKLDTAQNILGRLQLAYEYLPKWLQQGVVEWNKRSIELENGSKILASSTSSSAVRGGSYNLIFLDEFAFVPFQVAENFFNSVYPTITSGKNTKVVIVSTPNGMNMFYKLWMDANNKRNEYVPIEVHWSAVPGRDEKWKLQTIANTSQRQFDQEFACVAGDTIVDVRNKETGEIFSITMEKLHEMLSVSL